MAMLGAAAGLVVVYWLVWRGRLTLTHGFIFVTGLLIMGVKVFSVQYLLWLSPLIAYVYGLEGAALLGWGSVLLATTLYYPVALILWTANTFGSWLNNHTPLLIALRNLLMLLVGTLALRGALRQSGETERSVAPVAVKAGRSR